MIRSQDANHPFYMSAHMTGCSEVSADVSDGRGDPELVNVVSPQQYQRSAMFLTDATYPETDVVVCRSTPSGFAEVVLDCAGALGGWLPVGPVNTEIGIHRRSRRTAIEQRSSPPLAAPAGPAASSFAADRSRATIPLGFHVGAPDETRRTR